MGGQYGRRLEGQQQSALFYMDYGTLASSDPGWLQGYFSTLVGLSNWVVLIKNVGNTVGMVFRLCQATGNQSEASYKRWIKGAVLSYR